MTVDFKVHVGFFFEQLPVNFFYIPDHTGQSSLLTLGKPKPASPGGDDDPIDTGSVIPTSIHNLTETCFQMLSKNHPKSYHLLFTHAEHREIYTVKPHEPCSPKKNRINKNSSTMKNYHQGG